MVEKACEVEVVSIPSFGWHHYLGPSHGLFGFGVKPSGKKHPPRSRVPSLAIARARQASKSSSCVTSTLSASIDRDEPMVEPVGRAREVQLGDPIKHHEFVS